MPEQCVCVDLDRTILVQYAKVRPEHRNLSHLNLVTITVDKRKYCFYSINTQAMKKIFEALLKYNIQIVVITMGSYDVGILKALEELYALERGSLQCCLFINKNSKYNVPDILKGGIIKSVQRDGLISESAEVFLLDDDCSQLEDAEEHNYKTIKACGYPKDKEEMCNDYLHEVLDKVGLPVTFSMSDPAQRNMKRFKLRS